MIAAAAAKAAVAAFNDAKLNAVLRSVAPVLAAQSPAELSPVDFLEYVSYRSNCKN